MSRNKCELTIFFPCRNEEETIGECVSDAFRLLDAEHINGEVLVCDNGSTDASAEIAEKNGARIVNEDRKGYGNAIRKGINESLGKYIIMLDADGSYDTDDINVILKELKKGNDVVIGNRFGGGIEDGAMPSLNRYIGNPVLSFIAKLVSFSKINDFHCGIRGFSRDRILDLDLQCSGMELASEMIIKAKRSGLKMSEVPVTLHNDGRSGKSHLRPVRDGLRHLIYLLTSHDTFLPPLYITISALILLKEVGESKGEYYSPYVFTFLLGMFSFITAGKMKIAWPKKRSKKIFTLFSCVFSLTTVAAHYELLKGKSHNLPGILIKAALIFYGSAITFYCILIFFDYLISIRKKHHDKVIWPFFMPFLIFAAVDFAYMFFCKYPGILTQDSICQIDQIMSGTYDNHHPYWHTIMIKYVMDIAGFFTDNITIQIAAYSSFQIFLSALTFAYLTETIYRKSGSKIMWLLSMFFYACMPYHVIFSITMWKDIPYALCTAVFICSLFRINNDIYGNKVIAYGLLSVGGIGICLLRANGSAVFALFLIYMLYRYFQTRKGKSRGIAITLIACFAVSMILQTAGLKALKIAPAEADEGFGVPWQQISRVIAKGGVIDNTQYKKLSEIIDVNRVPEVYNQNVYDYIKILAREKGGDEYLTDHKKEFLKLWLDIGKNNIGTYAEAWIEQTKGFWNGGYRFWVWFDFIYDNDYDISLKEGNSTVSSFTNGYENLFFKEGPNLFISMGFHFWILLALTALALNRKKEVAYYILPLGNVITLSMAAPTAFEFRYIYSLFAIMPMLIMITSEGRKEVQDDKKTD